MQIFDTSRRTYLRTYRPIIIPLYLSFLLRFHLITCLPYPLSSSTRLDIHESPSRRTLSVYSDPSSSMFGRKRQDSGLSFSLDTNGELVRYGGLNGDRLLYTIVAIATCGFSPFWVRPGSYERDCRFQAVQHGVPGCESVVIVCPPALSSSLFLAFPRLSSSLLRRFQEIYKSTVFCHPHPT